MSRVPPDARNDLDDVSCICGHTQADMGKNVACEMCGELMPYHDEMGELMQPGDEPEEDNDE